MLSAVRTAIAVALASKPRERLGVALGGGRRRGGRHGALAGDDRAVGRRDAGGQVAIRAERAVGVARRVARLEGLQAVHGQPRVLRLLALAVACRPARPPVIT